MANAKARREEVRTARSQGLAAACKEDEKMMINEQDFLVKAQGGGPQNPSQLCKDDMLN